MNWAIVTNTWHMCRASKLRLVVITFLILYPLVKPTVWLCSEGTFDPEFLSDARFVYALVLAAGTGCIGRQLSDGTLSLVLSRPLMIWQYAISKWFAVGLVASIAALIQWAAELIVFMSRTPYLAEWAGILVNGVERILVCFGLSAVLVFFSSIVSGSKDLAVFLVVRLASDILNLLSDVKPGTLPPGLGRNLAEVTAPVVSQLSDFLKFIMYPRIDLLPILNQAAVPWFSFTGYAALVCVFLSLSIFCLNRKELPYGAD